jgi:hypothetical protein
MMKNVFIDILKLNPLKDPPPKSFMDTLKSWTSIKNHESIMVDAFVLVNFYKCQEITDMYILKEVLDLERNVDFL